MSDLFVLGFDPVFLDIIVIPMSPANVKLTAFPEIGEHVSNTQVIMLPGGNALNVARILTKLTSNVAFFGNFNKFFAELIESNIPALESHATTFDEPNVTVALQFATGEVQMNAVKSHFGAEHLSLESLWYLLFSAIIPFSNMGLNPKATGLFDVLYSFFSSLYNKLSTSQISQSNDSLLEFISDFGSHHKLANLSKPILTTSKLPFDIVDMPDLNKKILYFDSSTLQSFTQWSWLNSFFSSKFNSLPGFKIVSINEHEFSAMKTHQVDLEAFLNTNQTFLVVHEVSKVAIYIQSLAQVTILQVPPLSPDKIVSSVGPGDAFTAGLVLEFSKSFDIQKACQHAIVIAQQFLTGSL